MHEALLHLRRSALLSIRIRRKAAHARIGTASSDERLFRGGLRHDLGFLIGHFWLLSEAFASLFVSYFVHIGTRRAD